MVVTCTRSAVAAAVGAATVRNAGYRTLFNAVVMWWLWQRGMWT